MPLPGRSCSFNVAPLPNLAFEGGESALDDFAERHAVHEFTDFVTKALGFDDFVKAVVGSLRNPTYKVCVQAINGSL